jgi:hypothetical protein
VPFAPGYLSSWERNSTFPQQVTPAHLERSGLQVARKKWRCPSCRRRYRILVDYEPERCPKCDERSAIEAARPARPKILVEIPDPFVEFLSRITGRRFSSRRLVKSSIILAIVIAVVLICLCSVAPLEAVGRHVLARHVFAQCGATKHLDDETPPPNLGIVRVIRLPDFDDISPPRNPNRLQLPIRPEIQGHSDATATIKQGSGGPSNAELAAALTWLKNHRDDANCEVVKWWPARPVDDDLINYAGLLKTDRIARLQFRDNQAPGEQLIRDEIFVIRNNEPRAVPTGQNWWWDEWGGWTQLIIRGARRLLPDDDDAPTPRIADSVKSPLALPTKLVEHHPQRAKPASNRRLTAKTARSRQQGQRGPWWAKFADEADVDLVREWLKENLPAGQEIRWWRPRDLIAYAWSRSPRRSAVLPVEVAARRAPFLLAGGRPPDRRTLERVCRVKVRVEQPNQPPKVEDRLFAVASGKVEPILDPQHKRREWKYFPDAAGAKSSSAD